MPETIHFKPDCSNFSTAGGMGTYGFEILVGKTVFTDQEQLSNLAFCPPEEVLRSTALLAILFKE